VGVEPDAETKNAWGGLMQKNRFEAGRSTGFFLHENFPFLVHFFEKIFPRAALGKNVANKCDYFVDNI
jgi:hypothetical protein